MGYCYIANILDMNINITQALDRTWQQCLGRDPSRHDRKEEDVSGIHASRDNRMEQVNTDPIKIGAASNNPI